VVQTYPALAKKRKLAVLSSSSPLPRLQTVIQQFLIAVDIRNTLFAIPNRMKGRLLSSLPEVLYISVSQPPGRERFSWNLSFTFLSNFQE